jgi:hypothetical protein
VAARWRHAIRGSVFLCRVSIVAEEFVRLLHGVGMPKADLDLIHGSGQVVNELLLRAAPRSTLFTGSRKIAEKLALDLHGKVGIAVAKGAGPPRQGGDCGGKRRWTSTARWGLRWQKALDLHGKVGIAVAKGAGPPWQGGDCGGKRRWTSTARWGL